MCLKTLKRCKVVYLNSSKGALKYDHGKRMEETKTGVAGIELFFHVSELSYVDKCT